ncbi:MAG: hypothetical protein K1X55_15005 [Chitinophagales bacterium]|nr:hypothetical protein [Chitinophagales bacterium]
MNAFLELLTKLKRSSNRDLQKSYLTDYYAAVSSAEILYAIFFLSNKQQKHYIKLNDVKSFILEHATIKEWLLEASNEVTGDWAETYSLVMEDTSQEFISLSVAYQWLMQVTMLPWEKRMNTAHARTCHLHQDIRTFMMKWWMGNGRFTLTAQVLVQSLASFTGLTEDIIAQKLDEGFEPDKVDFKTLFYRFDNLKFKPVPFFKGTAIQEIPPLPLDSYSVEYLYSGKRCQIILTRGNVYIWTRSGEVLEGFVDAFQFWKNDIPDDTIFEGQWLAEDASISSKSGFSKRKRIDITASRFVMYDLLKVGGRYVYNEPYHVRRQMLDEVFPKQPDVRISIGEALRITTHADILYTRQLAAQKKYKGLIFKESAGKYGDEKGTAWLKLKNQPQKLMVVLLYVAKASAGQPYTEYTFGIRWQDQFLPITKAYEGLTNEEQRCIDEYVKQHTIEKFGPVKSIEPKLVFEISYEEIQASARHRSGVVLKSPKILRWLKEETVAAVATKEDINQLIINVE